MVLINLLIHPTFPTISLSVLLELASEISHSSLFSSGLKAGCDTKRQGMTLSLLKVVLPGNGAGQLLRRFSHASE